MVWVDMPVKSQGVIIIVEWCNSSLPCDPHIGGVKLTVEWCHIIVKASQFISICSESCTGNSRLRLMMSSWKVLSWNSVINQFRHWSQAVNNSLLHSFQGCNEVTGFVFATSNWVAVRIKAPISAEAVWIQEIKKQMPHVLSRLNLSSLFY